jgi:glycosyltransferase involved in cell wall biosynthesis
MPPKKIKILFAIGRMSPGGAEKLLIHELARINTDAFEPHLLTLFKETEESLASQVQIFAGKWKQANFASLFDMYSALTTYQFLRRERFDVLVTSLFSANCMVRALGVMARIPIILSYEHNLYPHKRRWQIFADRLLARRTHTIIVDAESVKKFTAAQEGIPEEKFHVMHIPPLTERREMHDGVAVRQSLHIPQSNPIVLVVSRLVPEKGHAVFIAAAEEVLKVFPDVFFLLVGWGPLKEQLELDVKSRGLAARILIPGRLDIGDVLPIADVYVEPALSVDVGIALMEAMRAGKAIVSTDVGEIPVFIQDGVNGFLVPPGESSPLADKIKVLLGDEALRKRLGTAAEKSIAAFSFENYIAEFEKLVRGAYEKKHLSHD